MQVDMLLGVTVLKVDIVWHIVCGILMKLARVQFGESCSFKSVTVFEP